MNPDLLRGYFYGLARLELESKDIVMSEDAGSVTYQYKITGPYEMKELDQMIVNEEMLSNYEPLNEEYRSVGFTIGKLGLYCNGSADDLTIVVTEFDELDELALESLRNAVGYMKPNGYEDFLAGYTKLEAAETDAYTVNLSPDSEFLREFGLEPSADRSYMTVTFGG